MPIHGGDNFSIDFPAPTPDTITLEQVAEAMNRAFILFELYLKRQEKLEQELTDKVSEEHLAGYEVSQQSIADCPSEATSLGEPYCDVCGHEHEQEGSHCD